MNFVSRPALLTVMLLAVPAAPVLAQNTNPANAGGGGAPVATPTYATPGANPALTTGVLPKGAVGIPADENPTVRGATGETIVKGDRSTISGDRQATVQQKTGGGEEGGGN